MCGFDGIQRGSYFGGVLIRNYELEVRIGKVAGNDEITGEMVKGGDDMVVDWIWRMCNMVFESGVVPEDCDLL